MKPLKPAKTIEQQIEILKSRGLIIEDEQQAKKVLLSVNYYNFTGYLYTYRQSNGDYSGITFNKAYRIYLCDKRIKSVILYAIEIVEHNLKTKIAYIMGNLLGGTSYLAADNYVNQDEYRKLVQLFQQAVYRNEKLEFVKHHLDEYGGVFPIWVAIELFTLGMVRNCYRNLKTSIQKRIAAEFHVGAVYLCSWIDCISQLRNMCAHYMRLYRANMQKTPKKSKLHNTQEMSNRIFDIINVIKFLIPDESEWNNYIIPMFSQIFEEYKDVVLTRDYGFPDDWEDVLIVK